MKLKLSERAKKDLDKLDDIIVSRIYKAFTKLRKEIARFKRLKGGDKTNSLRVGKYRVIFVVTDDTINIINVEHRREVYKNL
jgi:mRNA-degrading endonuclease RelE of RelBE toxin-antitoxin system